MSKVVGIDGSPRRPSTESLRGKRKVGDSRAGRRDHDKTAPASWSSESVFSEVAAEIDRRYDRLATPLNEYGYDPFGFDKNTARYPAMLMTLAYRHWFRTEAHGIENLPAQGPVLVVANHGGNTFAWDAGMIAMSILLEAEPPRLARGLAEFYLPTIPFFNEFMARVGSVVGTPENCRQLFERGECVLVFPEGSRGFVKPYHKAYKLQRFGLGFMRLALEHGVPILPVGVVGNEEQSPGLADVKWLGRLIGSPAFPITVTMPWLGPLGFLPLPVKFHLTFGALMRFHGDFDAEDVDLQPKVDEVKREISRLIGLGLARRRSWFF